MRGTVVTQSGDNPSIFENDNHCFSLPLQIHQQFFIENTAKCWILLCRPFIEDGDRVILKIDMNESEPLSPV